MVEIRNTENVIADYKSNRNITEILKVHKITHGTLQKIIKENGVPKRPRNASESKTRLAVKAYQGGMRQSEIARKLGVSRQCVSLGLRYYGIDTSKALPVL